MTNHSKFNRVIRKLYGRNFYCKSFYDSYGNKIDINKYEVYLKKEVDDMIKELRELYEEQQDEVLVQKRKASDKELENYQLKRKKIKSKEVKLEVVEDV